MSNEQWLTDGDCSKCRKVKYCSKDCKRRKQFMHLKIMKEFSKSKAGKMLEALSRY